MPKYDDDDDDGGDDGDVDIDEHGASRSITTKCQNFRVRLLSSGTRGWLQESDNFPQTHYLTSKSPS